MTEHRDTVVVKDGGSSTGLFLGIIAIVDRARRRLVLPHGPRRGQHDRRRDDINVNVSLPSIVPEAS